MIYMGVVVNENAAAGKKKYIYTVYIHVFSYSTNNITIFYNTTFVLYDELCKSIIGEERRSGRRGKKGWAQVK